MSPNYESPECPLDRRPSHRHGAADAKMSRPPPSTPPRCQRRTTSATAHVTMMSDGARPYFHTTNPFQRIQSTFLPVPAERLRRQPLPLRRGKAEPQHTGVAHHAETHASPGHHSPTLLTAGHSTRRRPPPSCDTMLCSLATTTTDTNPQAPPPQSRPGWPEKGSDPPDPAIQQRSAPGGCGSACRSQRRHHQQHLRTKPSQVRGRETLPSPSARSAGLPAPRSGDGEAGEERRWRGRR